MKRNEREGYKIISFRTDTWKYIYDEEKEIEYLFNLEKDPEENVNLINQEMKIAEEFRNKLTTHLNKVQRIGEKSKLSSVIQKLDLSKL